MPKILTKQGSKDMQRQIEKASASTIDFIVKEIEPLFAEVLIDQYGNYFCQKLFPKLHDEHKFMLLKTL